jgi:hypothetical protein
MDRFEQLRLLETSQRDSLETLPFDDLDETIQSMPIDSLNTDKP